MSSIDKLSAESPPINTEDYQGDANQALDLIYNRLNGLELRAHMYATTVFPKNFKTYDEERPYLSAKNLWNLEQLSFQYQLDLYSKHPILEPMCGSLIAEQLTRTPLPINSETKKPISRTPKIEAIAIKKALEHEARAAGTDISDLILDTNESIFEAFARIQKGQDFGLIEFFERLQGEIGCDTLNEILATERQAPAEKAKAIRDWILKNQEALDSITEIKLSNTSIQVIPYEICHFSNLITLNLEHNQIFSIPDSIGKLINLRHLDLALNQITSIPGSIGNLAQLEYLNLEHNQISSIPDSIGKLINLRHLDLALNQIISIPGSIGKLTRLKLLYLAYNKIAVIPDSIGQLIKLKDLGLAGNQISSIPDSIGKLTRLKLLYLAYNQITSIPDSIGKLTRLKLLYLAYNQISSIPAAVQSFPCWPHSVYLKGNPLAN